jgi:chemotaxis protein methyltransferase CheR
VKSGALGDMGMTVANRPLTLSYGDYLRFSKLVEDRFGLRFPEKRFADLEIGVRQAFAASTCTDLDQYYHLLLDPHNGGVEIDRLVNALTVNETYFFRDAGQFNALYTHVLPKIIERRRSLQTLRIWSAGCSTGEEPYSIAMMLRDLLPDVDNWSITILGTDVNTEALDRARKAVYSEWSFREEQAKLLRPRFFVKRGKQYELVPEVRRMVSFGWLNLAEDDYPAYKTNSTFMDLILCRNVTIYFTQPVIFEVVGRLYEALVDGGWLVVGHSETSPITYRRFQVHTFPNAILYQRSGQGTELPQDWDWLAASPKPVLSRSFPFTQPVSPAPVSARPLDLDPLPAASVPQPTRKDQPPRIESALETEESDPIDEAKALLDFGRSQEAYNLLLEVVSLKPNHAPACVLLGQACANLGHWEEAEKWCRLAVQLDRLSLKAYYTLALVLQHQGQLAQAIDAMKKVVYIDRNHIVGHFGLAGLYRNSGQLPQALKSLYNAHRLLTEHDVDEVVPDSGGVTAGRLQGTIVRQQQQWSVEASGA